MRCGDGRFARKKDSIRFDSVQPTFNFLLTVIKHICEARNLTVAILILYSIWRLHLVCLDSLLNLINIFVFYVEIKFLAFNLYLVYTFGYSMHWH